MVKHWDRGPERLCVISILGVTQPAWTWPWAIGSNWTCAEQLVGLDDLQRSLPTYISQSFCDKGKEYFCVRCNILSMTLPLIYSAGKLKISNCYLKNATPLHKQVSLI